jgi:hypothetical protein
VRTIDLISLGLSAAGMILLLGIITITQYRGPLCLAGWSLQLAVALILAGVILYCSAGDEKL